MSQMFFMVTFGPQRKWAKDRHTNAKGVKVFSKKNAVFELDTFIHIADEELGKGFYGSVLHNGQSECYLR